MLSSGRRCCTHRAVIRKLCSSSWQLPPFKLKLEIWSCNRGVMKRRRRRRRDRRGNTDITFFLKITSPLGYKSWMLVIITISTLCVCVYSNMCVSSADKAAWARLFAPAVSGGSRRAERSVAQPSCPAVCKTGRQPAGWTRHLLQDETGQSHSDCRNEPKSQEHLRL